MPLQNSQLEKELCLLEFLHIPKPAPSGGSGIKEWETAPLWGVLETEGEFQEELEGFGIWDPQILHLLGFSTLSRAGFWLFGKLFPSPNLTGAVEKSTQGKRDIPSISTAQSRDQFLPLRFPTFLVWVSLDPWKMGLRFPGAQEKAGAHNRVSRLIPALLGAGNSPLEIRSRLSRLPNLQPLRSGFNSLHLSGPAVGKPGDPGKQGTAGKGERWLCGNPHFPGFGISLDTLGAALRDFAISGEFADLARVK